MKRAVLFCSLSLLFAIVATYAWLCILMSCGMGPDSPAACNRIADSDAHIFSISAWVAYAIFTVIYWRRKRSGAR
jgi:hypothetical protein